MITRLCVPRMHDSRVAATGGSGGTGMGSVLIVGHRGAAGLAPENTLPAFLRAYESGIRSVELDVQLTADAVPAVFHDDRLERLTSARGVLRRLAWAELRGFRVLPGSFGGAYPDAVIPRLDELARELPSDLELIVELKPEPERGEELVRATLEALGEAGALARTRLISFDHALLRRVRRRDAQIRLGVLATERDLDRLLPSARELRAEAVHAPHARVDAELVRRARDAGFRINAWTVNSLDEIRRPIELGVDEITTDYPDRVASLLQRGPHGSAPEEGDARC